MRMASRWRRRQIVVDRSRCTMAECACNQSEITAEAPCTLFASRP